MKDSREALPSALFSLECFTFQILTVRRDGEPEGNLRQLLKLSANYIPKLQSCLCRTKCKWASYNVLSGMLKVVAYYVTRSLQNEVRDTVSYAEMIDETADIFVKRRVSICFRVVQKKIEIQELFRGFFHISDTRVASLFCILRDALCKYSLMIENCRRQCCDGAANIRGQHCELQALI